MSMIDPHVHLRDWNQKQKETLAHGLKCAKKAGFSHVFDMPNTSPAIISRDLIIQRLADASEALKDIDGIHYHIYGGLTADPSQIREMVGVSKELFPLVIGLKMFAGQSTGNMGIVDVDSQRLVFKTLVEEDYTGVLVVHAEKESELKPELYVPGQWETHSLARPESSEVESIRDILNIASDVGFKGTVHIAHISTKASVELVKSYKDRLKVTMGVTPHHSLLHSEYAKEYPNLYLKMNPPLRTKEDRSYIFQSLLDGTIDWVESDHAPHTVEDKQNGASGIPGFTGMLVLAKVLREAGISEDRLKDLYGRNVLKAFAMDDEEIEVPNDLVSRMASFKTSYKLDPFV